MVVSIVSWGAAMGMIDLRTVMLVSCGMLAIMGVVMVSAHRDLPDNIRGTGLWALGSLVLSASCAVVAMRDWMPGAVSVIVADAS